MTQPVKLAAKIAKVMEAVGYVAKTGTNSAQGYKFVQASAVADKVREQLVKFNVSMTPTSIDVISEGLTPSGKQTLLTLRFTWTLTDGDSGESLSFQSVGTGADSGDKAAYKAATGALKYALLTGFLIPTGDDPEADLSTDRVGAEFARGPQVAYDVWLSDKKEPKEKEFKTGTKAFEFFASRSTNEYQQWKAADKETRGAEPAAKYVYLTLTVFDKKTQEHLYKIYYKVSEAKTKNPSEKRPNLHVTGESRNVREYEGKAYEDVTVRDASPLIWTPMEPRE